MAGKVGLAPMLQGSPLDLKRGIGIGQMQEEIRDGGGAGVKTVEFRVRPITAGRIVLYDLSERPQELLSRI